MRELKFRVWNGIEMIYDIAVSRFGIFYVNPGNKGNGLDPTDSASITPFTTKYSDTIPVMQFTGVYDKNGREIFEGDIIRIDERENSIAEVIFDNAEFKLRPIFFPKILWKLRYKNQNNKRYTEVISNIFENKL